MLDKILLQINLTRVGNHQWYGMHGQSHIFISGDCPANDEIVTLWLDLTLDPAPIKLEVCKLGAFLSFCFLIWELNSPNLGGKRLFTWETQVARARESGFDTGTGQLELCSNF